MPIIIDNFQVNTSAPIDNRFVVGPGLFYLTKDDINYKYVGLRVWDSNDNIPYYWAGTEWLSENSVGVLADTNSLLAGESGYITKFTSGPTVVGKSLIYENQTTKQLGIGLIGGNINANYGSNPVQFGLHVAGNIKTNSYFIGNGLYITDINASNVNSGLLNIQYISPTQPNSNISPVAPGNSYVLFNNGSGIVSWRDTNNLSVLNSTNTTNVNVVSETSTTPHFVTFVLPGAAAVPIKYNSSKMQFKPDNGQLFLSNGGTTNPVYSFINSTNTGMYYNQGISIGINGNEITSTRTYGLVLNNRIYIQPTSNNTDVGYGIVWSTNGNSTNDNTINDGFTYNGQRLNFYGIGSHIPTDSMLSGGRGTYIAGYFGVDTFSGGRLKVKVDELNDVTINSRLNINLTNTNFDTLFNSTNASLVLSTMANRGGSLGNIVVIKDWSVRSALVPNTSTQDSWLTWKHHNGITIDGYYNTPNGPAKPDLAPDSPTYGTLTFWERHPYINEQYFGSVDRKTLTINSSTSPFVKVDGNLLVGTNTISPSAVADFTSTNKGIIPPRLTTAQRGTIVTPVAGLTIYNTTTKHMEVYDGTDWVGLSTTKVVSAAVTTLNRSSPGNANGWQDTYRIYNYAFIYPPTGYTISNLVGFIPSIAYIDFSGDVNSDDTFWCRYDIELPNTTYNSSSVATSNPIYGTTARIRVWCNNSENQTNSIVNYLAIWEK